MTELKLQMCDMADVLVQHRRKLHYASKHSYSCVHTSIKESQSQLPNGCTGKFKCLKFNFLNALWMSWDVDTELNLLCLQISLLSYVMSLIHTCSTDVFWTMNNIKITGWCCLTIPNWVSTARAYYEYQFRYSACREILKHTLYHWFF